MYSSYSIRACSIIDWLATTVISEFADFAVRHMTPHSLPISGT